jgi:hypothetical protein
MYTLPPVETGSDEAWKLREGGDVMNVRREDKRPNEAESANQRKISYLFRVWNRYFVGPITLVQTCRRLQLNSKVGALMIAFFFTMPNKVRLRLELFFGAEALTANENGLPSYPLHESICLRHP